MNEHHLPSKVRVVEAHPLPEPLRLCMILDHVSASTGSEEGWQGAHLLECGGEQTGWGVYQTLQKSMPHFKEQSEPAAPRGQAS